MGLFYRRILILKSDGELTYFKSAKDECPKRINLDGYTELLYKEPETIVIQAAGKKRTFKFISAEIASDWYKALNKVCISAK